MKPTLPTCLGRQMITCLVLFTLLFGGFSQTAGNAQTIYEYTNDFGGVPNFVDPNANDNTFNLSRGFGVSNANLGCAGATDGFGATGWPTTNVFNVNLFNMNGDFIELTVDPDPGFGLKVTGFSARSRRENLTGTADDGPIAIRYGFSIDGGFSWTTVNPGNPQSSNICASGGVNRVWPIWNTINTSNPIIFRIYGLSSGSSGNGDLFLHDVIVSGEVCADAPSITPSPADIMVCSGQTTYNYAYSADVADTYSIDFDAVAEAEGFVDVPSTALPAAPDTISWTIPAGAAPGIYTAIFTVANNCGFETSNAVDITVSALPDVEVTLSDLVICSNGTVTLEFTDNGNTGHLFSIVADLVDDNGISVGEINYSNIPDGATDTYTESVDFEASVGGVVSLTNIVVTDQITDCTSELADLTLNVNTLPLVSISLNDLAICDNGEVTLTFTDLDASGHLFTITADLVDDNGTEIGAINYNNIPSGATDTYTEGVDFEGSMGGTVSLTNIVVTDETTGCDTLLGNLTLTVNPLPNAIVSIDPSDICPGESITFNLDVTNYGGSETYNLSSIVTVEGGGMSPVIFTNESEGDFETWTEGGPDFEGDLSFGPFTVTETVSGCSSITMGFVLNVYDAPEFGFTAASDGDGPDSGNNTTGPDTINIDFCVGDNLTLSGYSDNGLGNIGYTSSFTSTGNVTYDGGPALPLSSGPVNIAPAAAAGFFGAVYGGALGYGLASDTTGSINQTLVPYLDTDNSGTLTPGDCVGAPMYLNYHIYAIPTVTVSASSTLACNGAPVSITFSGNYGAGASYSWTNDNAAIGLALNGTGAISFTAVNTGNTNLVANLTVTPSANGCEGTPVNFTITVYPEATMSVTATVDGGVPQTVTNAGSPNMITLDFCAGESFTFSLYNGTPGIGVLEEIVAGTTNLLAGMSPIPVPRPQGDMASGTIPGFFSGNYGPYSLSSGTYGWMDQVFTPYYDADLDNVYNPLFDCIGEPFTIRYHIYAPINLQVTRNNPAAICSGDMVDYTISTTSTEDVIFDLVLEENTNGGNPADLNDDNTLPVTIAGLTFNNTAPYNFTQAINNALGSFDRGRVRVRAINIGYVNADVCETSDVNGLNTQVYPEPQLEPIAALLSCDGNTLELDVDSLNYSINPITAGFPLQIEWTLSAPGLNEDGASGTSIIYDNDGLELNGGVDIAQLLTLIDPLDGPQTATFTITPRASGPSIGFNGDDCYGDPITVVVTVVPGPVPTIEGPSCLHVDATMVLSGFDHVELPATFVSGDWADDGSGFATVDAFGTVTGNSPGTSIIYYTVSDDAGCASTASHTVNVLGAVELTSVYTGGPVACGEDFTITVTADNFCDIGTLDYYFSWDPAKFQFVTYTAPAIPGGVATVSTLNVGAGQLVYQFYADVPPFGSSIPDGTPILTYTLRALVNSGTHNVPEVVDLEEAYNSNFSLVPVTSTGVSIEVTPPTLDLGLNPEVCPSDGFADLTYTNVNGNPNYYVIDWDALAEAAGFPDIQQGVFVPGDGFIQIPLPNNLQNGSYQGTLVISNTTNGCESQVYNFSIVVDQEDPMVPTPAPLNLTCVSNIPAPNPAVVVGETDNCTLSEELVVVYQAGLSSQFGAGCEGDSMVITRVYSVTDEAGNTTYVTHVITVKDDIAPTVSTSGMNTWYSSEAAAISAAMAIANASKLDNCTAPVGITVVAGPVTYSGFGNCNASIRLFVTDACGNVTDALGSTYTTIIDTENPTVTAGVIDDCYDEDETPTAPYFAYDYAVQAALAATTASDDCDQNLDITAVVTGDDCETIITVTATDNCGKSSSVAYTTRVENDAPLIAPFDTLALDGDCFDDEQEALDAALALTEAGDDCTAPGDLQYFAYSNGNCPASITVEVTDFCGNVASITYTGVHIDTEDPEVNPDPIYATCFKTLTEAVDSLAKAAHPYDNCTSTAALLASVSAQSTEVGVLDDNCTEYDIALTFTDNCGNPYVYTYNFILIDNTAPTAQPMAPLVYACLDDVEAPDTDLVDADDNCGVEDIVHLSTTLPTTCPGTGTRTYRVYDCSGNYVDVVQTISVNDDVAPTWVTTPGNDLDRSFQCGDDITPALALEPVAEDNCGEVTVMLVSSVPLNSCSGGMVRTWTAVDDCGNAVSAPFVQVISIIDNIAPSWVTMPDSLNAIVECSDATGLAAAQSKAPVAIDACTGYTLTKTSGLFVAGGLCAQEGTYTNTWVATDGCGNTSTSYTQVIAITDNAAPTWVTPQGQAYPTGIDLTISCDDEAGYAFAIGLAPTATDLCDGNLVPAQTLGLFVPGGDCIGEGSFTNTWIVTDDCGNTSTVFTQTITVIDNTPPTFNPQCQFMPLNLFTSGPQAADCHEGISLEVGDSLDYSTSWTVAGVLIPSMGSCIGDNCSPIGAIVAEVVSITDVPGQTVVIDQNTTAECVRQITVSFQLSDDCGNVQPTLFTCIYNIIDNTNPLIFCARRSSSGGPNLPEDCYPSVAAAEAAALEAITPCDNCTAEEDLVITVSTVGTCNAAITVTVADCAGNEDSYTFFTRIDNAAPVMTVSTIPSCYPTVAEAQAAAIAGTTITDDCDTYGNLIITAITTDTCPATVTITATDQCGHSSSVAYPGLCIGSGSSVNITDEADNLNVDCDGWEIDLQNWLASHGGAVATGSGIIWTYNPVDPQTALEMSMPNCTTHTKSVTVTFVATDGCGYQDSSTAIFSVTDNTPPVANLIANTNLSCSTGIPSPDVNVVTGEDDNCDETPTVAVFAVSDNGAAGCPGSPRTIIHTYSVTDDYCNTIYVSHVITVVDNIAPTFTAPANITITVDANCEYSASTLITGDVTNEADNCSASGPNLQAFYTDVVTAGVNNPDKYIITRTWQLNDACGNPAISKIQTITVQDNINPSIAGCPANITLPGSIIELSCGAYAAPITQPTYSDNCSGSSISYALSGVTPGVGSGYVPGSTVFNEGVTVVTYTVTDAVGNTATCSFSVTVNCLTISGRIIWEHDDVSGVKNATVNGANVMPTPAFMGSDLSDMNGNYDIAVPVAGTYRITPVKNNGGNAGRMNGVDAADATRITNHVNLLNPITDPYRKVCADVNRSNIINTQDATLITQCIAGNPTAQAVFNVFWRFTPTDYVMPGTAHQNVPAFPAFKDVPVAAMDVLGVNFFGMKIGDVDTAWANPQLAPVLAPLVWMVQDQVLVAGSEIELSFAASNFNDLAAYQFALDFDPMQLQFVGFQPLGAIPMNLADNFGAYNAELGELRNVWSNGTGETLADGTPVFKARFKVLSSGQKLSQVLKLDNSEIACKAFNEALVPTEVKLVFTESVGVADNLDLSNLQLQLMQNRPNPFTDGTTIGFILPEACEAHIRILDISGRELTSYDRQYTAGYHELEFRMENAVSYGVLFCELVTPQGKRTIKMMTAK